MNLTVATNWDNQLILEIAKINKSSKNKVVEVFGSIKTDFLGSSRPSEILPETSLENIKKHIKLCHENKIKFNYLINAFSFKIKEFTPDFRKKVNDFVKKLEEYGVDALTIANPLLIETIRKNFPNMEICASTVCKIDTLRRIEWYEDMKVDRIILETDINRDFKLLKKIREQTNLDLEALANLQCIFQCPNNTFDYLCDGFRSQEPQKEIFYNYPKIKCSNIKLKNPIEFVKSPWIRPEDIKFYEKIGINLIKISGREASTPWLINAISAYANEKYTGNLFDLIGNQVISNIGLLPIDNLKKIKPLNIILENSELDGFLDFFVQGNCTLECKKCKYCEKWSKKVKINPEERDSYIQRSDLLLDKIRKNEL